MYYGIFIVIPGLTMKNVLMKRYILLIIALLALFAPQRIYARKSDDLHFTDTLDTPKQKAQFLEALKLAPDVFVYDSYDVSGHTTVTVRGLRFNPSMKGVLASGFMDNDPKLAKKIKKINRLTRPLNASFDLRVEYHDVTQGIAVAYYITNVSVFGGGKVPAKEDY